MGRSPCCEKIGLKKGPWTPEEDQKLLAYIEEHGHGSWRALPSKAGLQRCGKSCRLRWTNYLRPDIKRGKFTLQEEQTIIQLHALLGNRWSAIATHLSKRTDNEIKNFWNTHLKKRLAKMGIDPVTHKPKNDALLSNNNVDGHCKNVANLSHMAQWESARLEAEARLVRQSKLRSNAYKSSNNGCQEFAAPNSPSTITLLNKPLVVSSAGPPRALDILKAWNGGSTGRGGGTVPVAGSLVGDLESPTSTLTTQISTSAIGENSSVLLESVGNSSGSSHEGCGMMKEENEEDWKGFNDNSISFTSEFQELTIPAPAMDSAWTAESIRANTEHVPSGNFVERFTDLLLNSNYSGGDRSFSDGGGVDSDSGGEGGSGDGSEYCDDNNNYWNNILSLVNSSSSDPSMF